MARIFALDEVDGSQYFEVARRHIAYVSYRRRHDV